MTHFLKPLRAILAQFFKKLDASLKFNGVAVFIGVTVHQTQTTPLCNVTIVTRKTLFATCLSSVPPTFVRERHMDGTHRVGATTGTPPPHLSQHAVPNSGEMVSQHLCRFMCQKIVESSGDTIMDVLKSGVRLLKHEVICTATVEEVSIVTLEV